MSIMPVESFRDYFSLHPWHSWQLANVTYPVSTDCDDVIWQYGWQANDAMGRKDIRTAIDTAENRLREYLGYSVAPHYVVETLTVKHYFDTRFNRLVYGWGGGYGYGWSGGYGLALKLGEGKVISIGAETRTSIGTVTTAGGSLVFSDVDSDGINDTFTATIATTVTDIKEIEVMFVAGDRMGRPAGDDWTVKPVTITLTGGNAIIVGRMWQIVRPALYESAITRDPSTTANFAASLDVYRHYCDTTGATVSIRDAENGIVTLGDSCGVPLTCDYCPDDQIEISYLAGDAPDSMGNVSQKWVEIVSRFAAAELNKRVCACVGANRAVYNQQIDRAFAGDARVEKFLMSQNDQNCPFGTREGQIYAWRNVRNLRQILGVTA